MKIIEPKVEFLSEIGISPESHIARCARVCYGKEYKEPNQEADKKMVDGLIKRNHLSMLRHNSAYFVFTNHLPEEFKSEYVGKMNMYLSLLDKIEKEENENQSIGIILCAEKDHLDVELALQDINKPIAVSDYELLVPKKELQTLVLNEMKQAQIADDDKE